MITIKPLTLSLVIPVYNEEHHIGPCLDAIAAQTDKPDEVIVVDNNSSDKTLEIAKLYPFVSILTEKKQGVVHARNTGFNAARGDVIARIDADTLLPPNWTGSIRKAFNNQKTDAVTGPVYYYDMPFSSVNYRLDHFFRSIMNIRMEQFPFLYGSNMAIRRSAWKLVADKTCVAKKVHEDLDLAIHLQEAGYGITYRPDMRGGVSARRYDDTLNDFSLYMKMYVHTYKAHERQGLMPFVAMTAYTTGYIALQPLRRSYDPKTGKRSIKQLVRGHTPRKNPAA
ncbi:glycosyltransferase family 2 protein [Candidatus Saccharibacteria bacterium]|nr:glycosyltransferase family 2 protein [Candidatus Saccharibacteria bacterium]